MRVEQGFAVEILNIYKIEFCELKKRNYGENDSRPEN